MSTTQSSRFQRVFHVLAIGVAVIALWQAVSPVSRRPAAAAATPSQGLKAARGLETRPIESIRPGMRVLSGTQTAGKADSHIDPSDWRLVRLTMEKSDGSRLDIELLRPTDWFEWRALQRAVENDDPTFGLPRPLTLAPDELPLAEALLGKELALDLPGIGASGPATVTAVLPCPEIAPAESLGHRVVTGTFHHSAAQVLDLQIRGEETSIGTTTTHPFWSEDRQAFVEAGQLQVGENLRRNDGRLTQVARLTPHTGPPVEVFNIEVDADHTYQVGGNGVLVHNECATGPLHHIVSIYDNLARPRAAAAIQRSRQVLANAGIGLNTRGLNGNLRRIPGHRGPHPEDYHETVADFLEMVTGSHTPGSPAYREAAEGGLNTLRQMILSGGLPLF